MTRFLVLICSLLITQIASANCWLALGEKDKEVATINVTSTSGTFTIDSKINSNCTAAIYDGAETLACFDVIGTLAIWLISVDAKKALLTLIPVLSSGQPESKEFNVSTCVKT